MAMLSPRAGHLFPHRTLTRGALPLATVSQGRAASHQRVGVARVQLQRLAVAGQGARKVASLGQSHAAPAAKAGWEACVHRGWGGNESQDAG